MQQFATDQPLPSTPTIPPDGLTQMVDNLFTSMLRMPLSAEKEPTDLPGDALQASVLVQGDWQAMLQVVASKEFASLTACAMFGLEPADISEEEVLDALGEVANVIGGNAKGVVNKDCSLSLPCVSGHDNEPPTPNATQLSFQYLGEPFQVILQEN